MVCTGGQDQLYLYGLLFELVDMMHHYTVFEKATLCPNGLKRVHCGCSYFAVASAQQPMIIYIYE